MRLTFQKTIALAMLTIAATSGCQNAMRIAHMMVEGQGIKRNLDDMNGAVDAEIAAACDVRPK